VREDKPLHVRVAQVLGWTMIEHVDGLWRGLSPHDPRLGKIHCMIARYDTNWGATGPLIERHGINLERVSTEEGTLWRASKAFGEAAGHQQAEEVIEEESLHATGNIPLAAVCDLLLVLAVHGKLNA
jgi:hypothetical protein